MRGAWMTQERGRVEDRLEDGERRRREQEDAGDGCKWVWGPLRRPKRDWNIWEELGICGPRRSLGSQGGAWMAKRKDRGEVWGLWSLGEGDTGVVGAYKVLEGAWERCGEEEEMVEDFGVSGTLM